jgi:hypothetical protein
MNPIKDNIMKYMAFCGGGKKKDIVQHVSKSAVSIFVD